MWVEGTSNHKRILNDLTKVFTTSNKDEYGKIIEDKNWELIHPYPFKTKTVSEIVLVDKSTTGDMLQYQAPDGLRLWSDIYAVRVYEDDATNDAVLLPSTEYVVDYSSGTVTFHTKRTNRIRADFTYIEQKRDIYEVINSIQNRVVIRTTIDAQAANAVDDPFGNDLDQHVAKSTMYVELFQTPFMYNPETPIPKDKCDPKDDGMTDLGFNGFLWEIDPCTGEPRPNYHFVNVRYFDRWDPIEKKPGKKVVDWLTAPVIDEKSGNIVFYASDSVSERTVKEYDPGTGATSDVTLYVNPKTGEVGVWEVDAVTGDETFVVKNSIQISDTEFLNLFADEESAHVIAPGGHSAPWMKWSWYRDYEEVLTDAIDADPSESDINDGMTFRYLDTPGLDKQIIPIKFHASTDNVKTSLVLQGDPSLNYDNYLISFGYFGAIESYYETFYTADSEIDPVTGDTVCVPVKNKEYYSNDTAGNFLVTVGSSTSPALEVRRDVITNAVIGMTFDEEWGKNTSDGTTDFSMFKTRSGLYFQKHHPAFVTPEQFLEKEMFNPSRWTGAYNLSQIHVVHGHDGYRGIMRNTVVVDDAALDHENELIVKEKQAEQKIYKFFAVNAPYSFIRNSPNVQYGIAILKE